MLLTDKASCVTKGQSSSQFSSDMVTRYLAAFVSVIFFLCLKAKKLDVEG